MPKNYIPPVRKPENKVGEPVNENIRFKEVLVIDENGTKLGIKNTYFAISLAREKGLDLYCVAPSAVPPVCKILNYKKFKFDSEKKAKENRKNQKEIEIKEVRLSINTDIGDMKTKAKHVQEWAAKSWKVKVSIRLKYKEIPYASIGFETINKFLDLISDVMAVDKEPVLDMRTISVSLSPKKSK
jgi:translation initiation factor IF-3